MKIKLFFLTLVLSLTVQQAFPQEDNLNYISIETGADFLFSDLPMKDKIRGNVPSYYNMGEPSENFKTQCYRWYAGIKAEKFWFKNKLGISTGLRFTQLNASAVNSTSFFYLLYQQVGLNTEYLRLTDIQQKSYYMGIPVDIRVFPLKDNSSEMFKELRGCYIKTGLAFNYRLQTNTDVTFYDHAMNQYEGDIRKMVGDPNPFALDFNLSFGYQLKTANNVKMNFEFSLPTAYLTKETTGLVQPLPGSGFQISIQLPINTKSK